jgi:hypothetical protein
MHHSCVALAGQLQLGDDAVYILVRKKEKISLVDGKLWWYSYYKEKGCCAPRASTRMTNETTPVNGDKTQQK